MSLSEHRSTQIAHVLFIDIVGYSKESIDGQNRMVAELAAAVSESPTYIEARARRHLLTLPTGDGMALVFFEDLQLPAKCSLEIGAKLAGKVPLRMGIHSGPVQIHSDLAGHDNVVGEAINTAQRVMDFGDNGHILLSSSYAAWLRQFDGWSPLMHGMGEGVTKHGERLSVFALVSDSVGSRTHAAKVVRSPEKSDTTGTKVVVIYKRNAEPDAKLLAGIEAALIAPAYDVFIDRHLKIGVDWARAIEERIREADAVIALISDSALGSEMLEYELEIAMDENLKRRRPMVLPIRIGSSVPPSGPIGSLVNSLNFSSWQGPDDNSRVIAEIVEALSQPVSTRTAELAIEPAGGAVSSESPFYVKRESDDEFLQALGARESILLVKGPRQTGKTSLIGRGLRYAKDRGLRYVTTDFQKLSALHFGDEDACYRMLAASLCRQFKFKYDFDREWAPVFGAVANLDNFVRSLIESSDAPLVWFMDEVDRLFAAPFSGSFFGLVRSWHNSRATEPDEKWENFTVVIAYATEAHLFIQDLNQSPFNIGRQLNLRNFTLEEVRDLNERYGSPLRGIDQIQALYPLIEGQPFLTRRALEYLVRTGSGLSELVAKAHMDDGPFGDHLKRVLVSVSQLSGVLSAMRASLSNIELQDTLDVQRLVSAGVLVKRSGGTYGLRCGLYHKYLSDHIGR